MENNNSSRQLNVKYIFICFFLCAIIILCFTINYKANIAEKLSEPVTCTLTSLHKSNFTIELTNDNPTATQVFNCTVPELKSLNVFCKGKKISKDSILKIELKDFETGEIYYSHSEDTASFFKKQRSGTFLIELDKTLDDSEGRLLTFSLELFSNGKTTIDIRCNSKPGIVKSFNSNEENKTNIIYDMSYSNQHFIKKIYCIFMITMLIFVVICYYILIIRKVPFFKASIFMAIFLGIAFNFVIVVHGVPDEPLHFDTVYKYSNKILSIDDTGIPGTIYKRQCDTEMEDMLVNGVESNSYFQLYHHLFETPDNQELQVVSAFDTGTLVPDIIFIPAALGISLGRICHMSALMTLMLGRTMNLIAFIILIGLAIHLAPVGKNIFAIILLLPITLQQAASVSYDMVPTGIIILFIAVCLKIAFSEQIKLWQYIILAFLIGIIFLTKGGVYLPVCLLLLFIYLKRRKLNFKEQLRNQKGTIVKAFGIIAGILLVAAIFIKKYVPLYHILFNFDVENDVATNPTGLYNVPYLLSHPLKIVYMYWNTLLNSGDEEFRGLLGGTLSWLNVKINWLFIITILICVILLANTEHHSDLTSKRFKSICFVASIISISLVMMSMLVGYTKVKYSYITGLQGRYYLPLLPLLLYLINTRMVQVTQDQEQKISMVLSLTEIMVLLDAFTLIINNYTF